MAEKKKQHYIPKFYLKRFALKDRKMYMYDITKDTLIFDGKPVPYKDQFYKNYYYGDDKLWENKLSELENKWDISFSNIIDGNYNNSDIDNIKEFAIYQYGRTVFQLEQQTNSTAQITYETLKMHLANNNMGNTQAFDIANELSKKKAQETTHPAKLLDIFQKINDEVSDLTFKHIIFDTKESFISSDNPIAIINPYVNNIGFGMIGLVIIFPMSSKDLCILYDKKIYTKITSIDEICRNEYIIKKMNSLFYVNANSLIYSNKPFSKNLFKQVNKQMWIKNSERCNVSSFGTNKDKMVVVHWPSISFDKLPYFLMVDGKFTKISPEFRTPVPRKYDAGFERKLIEEYITIPKILSNFKGEQINDEYISNYETNHKNYYSLIMEYWDK